MYEDKMENSQVYSRKLGNPGLETGDRACHRVRGTRMAGLGSYSCASDFFIFKTTPVDFYSPSSGAFSPGFSSPTI